MKLTVLSFSEAAYNLLAPAPSVQESERICESMRLDSAPPVTNLDGAQVTVLDDYRGHMLYCSGGVTVYRSDPTTNGGNGLVSLPGPGVEEAATIFWNGKRYSARVRFA